jgi:UDPglucose 6-dehydrogenase
MVARIAVIGCGHVGLVMATGLASLGHKVIGVDLDQLLVDQLNEGRPHIWEEGLEEAMAAGIGSGLLRFTTGYDVAVPDAEFIFLAVDTPPTVGGAADLRKLRSAARSVAAHLNGSGPIVINKCTSPVGTGALLETILGDGARVVANPEFLRQGSAMRDFMAPDRIIVGSSSGIAAMAVARLYDGLPGELIVTDLRTAEMTKYVANAFLAARISFINEVARLCESMDTNIDDVVAGIAADPRIGPHFLRPGIGYGGSCFPKDVAALRYLGEAAGVPTPLLGAVQETNAMAKTGAIRRLRRRFGSLEGRVIAVWGLTFKAGTEDTRESPAMEVVSLLRNEGAVVRAYDPAATELIGGFRTALDAVEGADALAILTDWPEFGEVNLGTVYELMRGCLIFDGRNLLDPEAVEEAGLDYIGVGRRPTGEDW